MYTIGEKVVVIQKKLMYYTTKIGSMSSILNKSIENSKNVQILYNV